MPKKELPKFMITYLCHNCGQDFAISERDKPQCFYCEAKDNFEIIKKQVLTPEVMMERLKFVSDRMMANLKMAYQVKPDDVDDGLLLKTLDKAKKFNEGIKKIKIKSKR